jgi:hypothetical protein
VSARRGTPRRATRRARWIVGGFVAVLLALVGAAGATMVALSQGGSPLPDPTATAPLLPGAPTVTVPPRAPAVVLTGVGFDVSYPQCRSTLPKGAGFGIVGVNGGAPLTSNKCLAEQVAWARGTGGHAVYVNTSYPGYGDPVAFGRRIIDDAIGREHKAGVSGTAMWWLDVETTNTWAGTTQENATVLASMAARLQESGVRVGIYSSPQQWQEIAGGWSPGLPVWNATGPGTQAAAATSCAESFAGSTSAIVQWVQRSGSRLLDHNLVCPPWRTRGGDVLDVSGR